MVFNRSGIFALTAALAAAGSAGASARREPVRYFVGLELSPALAEGLGVLKAELARLGDRRIRWSPDAALHLTLRFLGPLDAATRDALAARLELVAAETSGFPLQASGIGSFPWRGRGGPRVLWAGVAEPHPELEALAEAVDAAALELGLAPADFPFRPHVTLGRAARGAVGGDLAAALERLETQDLGSWEVRGFVLWEARRDGPQGGYVPVRRFALQ